MVLIDDNLCLKLPTCVVISAMGQYFNTDRAERLHTVLLARPLGLGCSEFRSRSSDGSLLFRPVPRITRGRTEYKLCAYAREHYTTPLHPNNSPGTFQVYFFIIIFSPPCDSYMFMSTIDIFSQCLDKIRTGLKL